VEKIDVLRFFFQTRIPTFLPIGLLWAASMASKETGPNFFFCFSLVNVVKASTGKSIGFYICPKSGPKLAKIKNYPKKSNAEHSTAKKSITITKTLKSVCFNS
jgi:hypothetical protein